MLFRIVFILIIFSSSMFPAFSMQPPSCQVLLTQEELERASSELQTWMTDPKRTPQHVRLKFRFEDSVQIEDLFQAAAASSAGTYKIHVVNSRRKLASASVDLLLLEEMLRQKGVIKAEFEMKLDLD